MTFARGKGRGEQWWEREAKRGKNERRKEEKKEIGHLESHSIPARTALFCVYPVLLQYQYCSIYIALSVYPEPSSIKNLGSTYGAG